MTAPATFTPVTAMPAAPRTTAPTASPEVAPEPPEGGPFTAVVRLGELGFRLLAGLAAAFPLASAFTAALAAVLAGRSRFALRLPGREFGRFPSTPPSSVMDGDSSSARTGYTEVANEDDKVVRRLDWLTG